MFDYYYISQIKYIILTKKKYKNVEKIERVYKAKIISNNKENNIIINN